MHVQVKAHRAQVTPALAAHIERKIGGLDRYLDRVIDAKLELHEEQRRTGGIRYVAQLTIATNYALLRAEEEAADAHTAVDAVAVKMERQIARYRSKWKSRRHGHGETAPELPMPETTADDVEEPETTIVRSKTFSAKPIPPDEAIEQMELLGHAFFAFINADDGQVNVVYRRQRGGYGLLQPARARE